MVVALTISNRDRVIIDLWPAPLSLEIPIFAAVFAAVFIGFLLGGFFSFFSVSRRILRNRQLSKALKNARREEVILKKELKTFKEVSDDSPARSKIQSQIQN